MMVWAVAWRKHLNSSLSPGLACCAAGLVLGCQAAAANADAVAFKAARPCATRDLTADGCYEWLTGRVTAIGARTTEGVHGPGHTDIILTIDLPVGQRTVLVVTTLPPGKPQVGDPVDAKLWRGQVTDVSLAGVTVGTASRPVMRLGSLLAGASVMVIIGLLLIVAYVVDRRAGYI